MLPFAVYEFFIVMIIFIAIIHLSKRIAKTLNYSYLLAILNALFLVVFFPQPIHLIIFIAYAWLLTYWLISKMKPQKKIWGIILLLAPMLFVKANIRFHHYPFELNHLLSFAGLSYTSFRIVGNYMDMANGSPMIPFLQYFNFLSFTPTLLIGPIEKFSRFQNTVSLAWTNLNADYFLTGWHAFLKGFTFKFILAEIVDRYWLGFFDHSDQSIASMASTMYAYYVYLFFDFAGYSHMAVGIARMMGMDAPVNFTNPFKAKNPQEFWRSFHISLGDWLKDYFFTPLYIYFSRKKKLKAFPLLRQNAALFLTFLLMGCWNGFTTNFILSGSLFGLYSAIHNSYLITCKKRNKDVIFGNLSPGTINIISIVIMIHLVAFSLYIFSGRFPYL